MKIPEDEMKAIVLSELPPGVFLESISLEYGSMLEDFPENFVLQIRLKEDEAGRQQGCPGLGYNIAERLRNLLDCGPDQLHIALSAAPLDMHL
jgi:hypothetical protein